MNLKTPLSVMAGFALFAGAASRAVEIEDAHGAIIIRNTCARLELNRSDFALKQIRDLVRGADYVAEPGGSLFLIALWDPKHPGNELKVPNWFSTRLDTVLDAKKATSFKYSQKIKNGKAVLTLKYLGIPAGLETGRVDVTVTIGLADGSGLFEWGISMANASGLQLYEVYFPVLEGLASSVPGSEKTDYVAVPRYSGVKRMAPRSTNIAGQGEQDYPNPGMSVQLLSYCDGQGGTLYFACHDPAAYRKTFSCQPCPSKRAFRWYVNHYADQPGLGKWTLPYPVFCGPMQGDWYDAAKLYKTRFADHAWKPLSQRTDIAPWFRDLSVWFQGSDWDANSKLEGFSDRLVKLRAALGEDYGFHWYLWQKYIQHDYRYPDYFPARPGFTEAVAKAERAGVHVMPYTNMHLFDPNLPMWKEGQAEASVTRDISGAVSHGGGCGEMVPMCLGTAYWQNKVVDIERQLLRDYQVDALYLDELYSFPTFCYATNHGHPGHGGTYCAAGSREILTRLRALKEWGGKPPVITGENLGEAYIDGCDGLINGHSDMKPDTLPIFQAVHSNHTTEIGVFLNQSEIYDMDIFMARVGFNLVRGRQLGWFNFDQFDITKPEFSKQLGKLRAFCQARRAAQEFLFFGELLRTPDLSALPTAVRRWEIWADYSEKINYTLPVVLAECYRAPNGDIGLVLVNHTAQEQSISIPWNFKDWGFKLGESVVRQDCRDAKWTAGTPSKLGQSVAVSVPAYSPLIIRISRPSPR